MKTLKSCLVVMFVLSLVAPVFAQSKLLVADDSSSGTYKKMFGEIIGVCPDLDMTEAPGLSGGAVGNLQTLVDNKAQVAFLHHDVFYASAQADPTYNKFATLVALYPEPIHILALKQSKITKEVTTKAATWISKAVVENVPVEFNSLADVVGYKVAGAGGGAITVRVIKGSGGAGFEAAEYPSGADVLKALDNGEIAAAIFVGAAPLPNIEKLDKSKYKLIPMGDGIASRLGGIYREARINYPGLTSGPIKTLAPLALVMTRRYSTPEKIAAQRHFRECFTKNLPKLQDDGAPNWQSVEANSTGLAVVPYLELPGSGPAKK